MPIRGRSRRRSPAPEGGALRGLGERIRAARTAAGLSQTQLGAPHFTRAYVSAVELGKIHPSMKSLEFLASRLSRPAASLLADDGADAREAEALLSGRPASLGPDPLAEARALVERGIARRSLADLEQGLEVGADLADLERLAARYLALGEERLRAGDARSALGPLRRGVALRAAARDRALAADAARMRADLRAGRDAPARRAPR